ncbi:hypothetical protein WA158_008334 [Blastocystis sp. Blastoise]
MELKYLPEGYFSVNETWSNERKPRRHSSHSGSMKKVKRYYQNTRFIVILVVVVVFILLVGIITTAALMLTQQQVDPLLTCPTGFNLTGCGRDDFLGYMSWTKESGFRINDEVFTQGVAFRIYAPIVEAVLIKVSNSKTTSTIQMTSQVNGYWFAILGGYTYGDNFIFNFLYQGQYYIRHSLESYEFYLFETNNVQDIITDLSFDWEGYKSINHISRQQLILYHIHIPTFNPTGISTLGSYSSVESRLDYLQELGINTLVLMPIEPLECSITTSSKCWSDASTLYPGKLHPSHGSLYQLKSLIKSAHKHNLFVIFEVNWSLFSSSCFLYNYEMGYTNYWGPFFNEYNLEDCPLNKNRLNLTETSRGRQFLTNIIQKWKTSLGIDGISFKNFLCFRTLGYDCSRGNSTDNTIAIEFFRQLTTDLSMYYIAEDNINGYTIKSKIKNVVLSALDGGLGFTGQYEQTLFSNVIIQLANNTISYNALENYFNHMGLNYYSSIAFIEYPTYLTSVRLRRLFSPSSPTTTTAFRKQLLSLFFLFTLPDIPYLFMGTEYMTVIPFAANPQSLNLDDVGVYENGRWIAQGSLYPSFLATQTLISLRKAYTSFASSQYVLYYHNTRLKLLAFYKDTLVFVINYSLRDILTTDEVQIDFPYGNPQDNYYKLLFTSDSTDYHASFTNIGRDVSLEDCSEEGNFKYPYCSTIPIARLSVLIYELRTRTSTSTSSI